MAASYNSLKMSTIKGAYNLKRVAVITVEPAMQYLLLVLKLII